MSAVLLEREKSDAVKSPWEAVIGRARGIASSGKLARGSCRAVEGQSVLCKVVGRLSLQFSREQEAKGCRSECPRQTVCLCACGTKDGASSKGGGEISIQGSRSGSLPLALPNHISKISRTPHQLTRLTTSDVKPAQGKLAVKQCGKDEHHFEYLSLSIANISRPLSD